MSAAASDPDFAAGNPIVETSRLQAAARVALPYVLGVLVALAANGLLLLAVGASPVEALTTVLDKSVGGVRPLGRTLEQATPIAFGGIAVAFAMQAGYVNLGIDGQIRMGAVGAGLIVLGWNPDLGPVLLVPLVMVAGALGGCAAASVAAALRAYRGVNELFTTVMLNFVALYLVDYLTTGPWNDRVSGEAVTRRLPEASDLPVIAGLGNAHIGILLPLPLAVAAIVWLWRSRAGFEYRAVGANRAAASFGGVRVTTTAMSALLVAGSVGGLAGAVEATGVHHNIPLQITNNFGFLSVLVAVLARRNPGACLPVAVVFAALITGSDGLQRVDIPASGTFVFQAVVVLVVLYFQALFERKTLGEYLRSLVRAKP